MQLSLYLLLFQSTLPGQKGHSGSVGDGHHSGDVRDLGGHLNGPRGATGQRGIVGLLLSGESSSLIIQISKVTLPNIIQRRLVVSRESHRCFCVSRPSKAESTCCKQIPYLTRYGQRQLYLEQEGYVVQQLCCEVRVRNVTQRRRGLRLITLPVSLMCNAPQETRHYVKEFRQLFSWSSSA